MIICHEVTKDYSLHGTARRVLDGVSFAVEPGEKLAILGRNGAGKSTLIRIVGGVELPTGGTIVRGMSLSWPLAFSGGFQGSLTGHDNIRFISRLYDVSYKEIKAQVEDFSELGSKLSHPVKTYSSGMRQRLSFGLSLAIDFDCYLIDEVIAVGDASFAKKCHYELFEKRKHKSIILASHMTHILQEYCQRALVLKGGRGKVFDDLDTALDVYNGL